MPAVDPLDFSAFEQQFNQPRQKDVLNLRFFIQPTQNGIKTLAEGRPIYDEIEYVAINVPGSRDEFIEKITEKTIEKYPHQYAYWKKTREQPVDGTPLTMVPFLNLAQVEELRALNIKTLEQLAQISDLVTQKVMGLIDLRKKAQAYLKAAGDGAQVQRLMNENETLRADLKQLRQQMAEINQRYEALLKQAPVQAAPAPAAPAVDIQAIVRAEIAKMMNEAKGV